MSRAILLAALAWSAATASLAQAYDAPPVVTAASSAGSAASIHATMDVAAPPAVVWATLIDCEHATRFMPKLISCKVLQKDPAGRWELREHRLRGGLLKAEMRNVFRADFTAPRRLSFHRVAGDWKRSEGEWNLSPIAGGVGTHVDYRTEVAVNGPVPVALVRQAVAKGMPQAMLALRREAVARAHR
ncbi:SRPBCC family protein [Phenylobacterium sp.]|uniref:SRPBCC family protein n=1 Tax=Phenylobacterium sp. TaxID=1871053 RepID=UPI002735AD44|nr:SRPBCC family protein [Phenylobacterium sp.]MDP3659840.1 SRPBCC family protein [Phenylobacterium sp.]